MAYRPTQTLNQEAAAWFARLQRPDIGETDRRAFDAWIDADPARAVAYARIEATWERAGRLAAAAPLVPPRPTTLLLPPISRRAAAAALLTLGAGGAATWWTLRDRVYATRIGERRTIVLDDGSRIEINTGSRVEVAYRRDLRQVRLMEGEALFEVAKDPHRPFIVHARAASVRAVGTAFNVRLRAGAVEVTVTEGLVTVADASSRSATGETPARIPAGRGAVVGRGGVTPADLDNDTVKRRTAWRQGVVELRGETLEEAVAEFNRYRTSRLVVADRKIAAIRVGGTFETDESDKFLAALRIGFGVATREAADGTIHLYSAT